MHITQRRWLRSCTVIAASCLAGIAAAADTPTKEDPRIEQMTLQLTKAGLGRLGLQLHPGDRERLNKETNGHLTLMLDEREGKVDFNDAGEGADVKRGDGIFSAEIPVSFPQLERLNGEVAKLKVRRISRFIPGTREVAGVDELPETAIDLIALKEGRVIRLPRLGEFGPLQTLGGSPVVINPQKSLLLRSLPIIEDSGRTHNPCGPIANNNPLKAWTFGHLMQQMSIGSGLSASQFTEQWLNHWKVQQQVLDSTNSITLDSVSAAAAANMDALVINPWRQRSGGGALNLSIAPFRLLAIVNRPDLALSSYTGGPGNNGGELRFVFGLMEARDQNNDGDALDVGDTCQVTEMAVIFEYGVPIRSCQGIKTWANDWVSLSGLLPGDPAFNDQLELLTESVVKNGAAPTKPNQNALNQLRTNEIDLTGIWQFREFHITTGSGPLLQALTVNNPREHQAAFTATGLTPAPINLNGSPLLLSEIQNNLTDIVNGDYSVQETSAGFPFQGGASSYNINTSWDHPGLSTAPELTARFKFSLNTCSSCHTGETDTTFYHIRPTPPGSPPVLSGFLLNNPHNVVDVRMIPHQFNEMDNRKQALSTLANQSCRLFGGLPPFQVMRARLRSVH
jgi:hypothetical protein